MFFVRQFACNVSFPASCARNAPDLNPIEQVFAKMKTLLSGIVLD